MAYDALETVQTRNNFYRDCYHKVVVALLLSFVIILGLVVTLMIISSQKPTPKYFAATDSGRIIPLVPLDQPNLSSKALLQWASQAVVSVYSYDFVHFKEAFQSSQQYFTDAGWKSFMKALGDSKNLDAVQEQKLVVSAVLTGAPIITNQYVLDGRYIWIIQMPILVTYQGGSNRIDQNLVITLKVQRTSTLDNVYGVGIGEFVVEQK